jgi:protein-tyrosine phosphatase
MTTDPNDGNLADLSTHHIEGIARHGSTPFKVSLFSQIEGNLWMGGCPRGDAPRHFDYIVCLYPWEHYVVHEKQVHLQAQLFDSNDVPAKAKLVALAKTVNAFVEAGPTLVHCQAGLNRSGLVTALSLMLRGRTAEQAIALVRAKRCGAVLCNDHFENWLRDLPQLGIVSLPAMEFVRHGPIVDVRGPIVQEGGIPIG